VLVRAVPDVDGRFGVGRLGADFPGADDEEADDGVLFFGGDFLAAGFAGGFLTAGFAAFQAVPQTRQELSELELLVSHFVQRQSPDGRAAAGRFAAGRGLLLRGGAAAAGAGVRRVLPQIVQVFSAGPLKVSQSPQRQLAAAIPCYLSRLGR
jgi:hypothetical protein